MFEIPNRFFVYGMTKYILISGLFLLLNVFMGYIDILWKIGGIRHEIFDRNLIDVCQAIGNVLF